jgi:hypothetical protein
MEWESAQRIPISIKKREIMSKVKIGDINLSFEVEGEGSPLVIVNGGGASVAQMKEIGTNDHKILEAGYKLIRFDN